jgi:hypothetical protein
VRRPMAPPGLCLRDSRLHACLGMRWPATAGLRLGASLARGLRVRAKGRDAFSPALPFVRGPSAALRPGLGGAFCPQPHTCCRTAPKHALNANPRCGKCKQRKVTYYVS